MTATSPAKDGLLGRVLANAGMLLGGRTLNAVISLGYMALAARSLGVANFGVLVLINTFAQFIGDVARFQSWQTVLQFGPAPLADGRRADFQRVIRFGLVLDIVSAVGGVARIEMGAGSLNLAGALSRIGGLDTNTANARSVLLFRFERPEVAQALGITQPAERRGVPVVYRLNLEEASGFFTANNVTVQPDDIIYVPRSGSAELGKFFTLVQTVTRVVYDVSVTSTLNNN